MGGATVGGDATVEGDATGGADDGATTTEDRSSLPSGMLVASG